MYECPNCAGNLKFDIARQQLYCEHCDTAVDPYSIYKEKDAREHSTEYEVTVFTCPQCGGEILSEDNTAATFCSFCGAATILDSRISKERRPARIIPFAKTKEDCKSAYAKMMRRAVFAPKILKDQENIEKFRGIYMPYWVYSFEKSGASSFFPRTKRYRQGDYVYAEDYRIDSEIQASYEGITYDASASFDDSLSKAIGPFDLEKGKTFTPTFLSGFYADTSDVDAEVYLDDATETVVADGCERLSRTSICKTHRVTESELRCAVEPAEHNTQLAMLPVWFLSYRNGDKISYAVVNGQTGKAAAEIPVDPKKYFLGSMLLAVPLFVLLNLFFTFTPTTVLLFAVVLALCCMGIANIQVSNLLARKNGEEDQGLKFMQEKAEAEAETSVAPESATAENEKKNSGEMFLLAKAEK